MKRKLCVVLLLAGVAATGFAMDRAFGVGGMFGETFNSGEMFGGEPMMPGDEPGWKGNRTSGGAFVFLGLSQFAELNLGYLYKSLGEAVSSVSRNASALQAGIYGKYPIPISDKMVFFPTGGIDLELNLNGTAWWNDVWLRAGVGLDFFLSDRMFLRSHLLYGAAIPVGDEATYINVGHGVLVKFGIGWMF